MKQPKLHTPAPHQQQRQALRLRLGVAMATAALLVACGGGGDDGVVVTPNEPLTTVPDSATASVDAYTAFTLALIAAEQGSQTATPLLLNSTEAPISESAVPVPLV